MQQQKFQTTEYSQHAHEVINHWRKNNINSVVSGRCKKTLFTAVLRLVPVLQLENHLKLRVLQLHIDRRPDSKSRHQILLLLITRDILLVFNGYWQGTFRLSGKVFWHKTVELLPRAGYNMLWSGVRLCHKLVLYREHWPHWAGSRHRRFSLWILHSCVSKTAVLPSGMFVPDSEFCRFFGCFVAQRSVVNSVRPSSVWRWASALVYNTVSVTGASRDLSATAEPLVHSSYSENV